MSFKIWPAITLFDKLLSDPESGLSLRLLDGQKSFKELAKHEFAKTNGIYVFALKKPGGPAGAIPWYIGKTEVKTLGKEALTKDKIEKYSISMIDSGGKPTLYCLTPGGTADKNRIDDLETFLIWLARQKNSQLINKQKVKLSPEELQRLLNNLEVSGFLNSGAGAPGLAAAAFTAMVGWTRKMNVLRSDY